MLDINDLKSKRTLRFCLVFIPALVWDLTYGAVKILYDAMTKVDQIGEEWLEEFIEGE